jgi:hypothetical protein
MWPRELTFSVDAAEKLGVTPPPPFLSLSMYGKDVLGGINFASGGAGILNETGVYFVRHAADSCAGMNSGVRLCNTTSIWRCRFSTCRSTSRYRALRSSRRR